MSQKIVFDEKSYIVKYPTVGQLLEIESLKQSMSGGRYGIMAISGVKSMEFALDLIDSIAYFSILIPELRKQLEIKSFLDLDAITAKKLTITYRKQFNPWYKQLEEEMSKLDDDIITDSNNGKDSTTTEGTDK